MRKLVYKPLVDLVPNERNPKSHDTDLIDQSVGRFGFIDPVLEDGRTGKLIGGHGRTKALRAMEKRGDSPPEGVQVDKNGRWLVPVIEGWSSRTDSEAHAALIALNRATEVGGWVDDELLGLLEGLSTIEDGFAGVGYDEDDLEVLRKLSELTVSDGENNPYDEFADAGVDDFENEDIRPAYSVRVNFLSEEDYEAFREKLELEGNRVPVIWYPEQPDLIESTTHLVAVDE